MIAIDIGKRTFDLPESWEEIVGIGKYLDVIRVNYTSTDVLDAKKQLVERLAGLSGKELGAALGAGKRIQREKLAEQIDLWFGQQLIEEVYPVLDFLFKPELLTVNPLPVIRLKGIDYYGPGEKLADQTGAEMEECGQAHAEFIKTGDEQYLDLLIAAMYRPRWALLGPKMKFDAKRMQRYAKRFKQMDPIVKRGVLLYYEMCEEWWRQGYEFLYGAPEPVADGEAPQIDSLATSRIVRALAGNKRGTVEDVRKMERQEIFFELAELERERQEAEANR